MFSRGQKFTYTYYTLSSHQMCCRNLNLSFPEQTNGFVFKPQI